MKLLLIRHAIALSAEEHRGDDLSRPLTKEGSKKARRAFEGLARLYPAPDMIITSPAERARETAFLLRKVFRSAPPVRVSESLRPGSDYGAFVQICRHLPAESALVAFVGHEPDFSDILAALIGSHRSIERPDREDFDEIELNIELKKAACAEVEMLVCGSGILKALLPPSVLRKLA